MRDNSSSKSFTIILLMFMLLPLLCVIGFSETQRDESIPSENLIKTVTQDGDNFTEEITRHSSNRMFWVKERIEYNSYSDGPCSGSISLFSKTTHYWDIDQKDLGEGCFRSQEVLNSGSVLLTTDGVFAPQEAQVIDASGEVKYSLGADSLSWALGVNASKSGNTVIVIKENREDRSALVEYKDLLTGKTWEKSQDYFKVKSFMRPQISRDDKVIIIRDWQGTYNGVYDSDGVRLWERTNCSLTFLEDDTILFSAPPEFQVLKKETGDVVKKWSIQSESVQVGTKTITFDDVTFALSPDYKGYVVASKIERIGERRFLPIRYLGYFDMNGKMIGIKKLDKFISYPALKFTKDLKGVIVTSTSQRTNPELAIPLADFHPPGNK